MRLIYRKRWKNELLWVAAGCAGCFPPAPAATLTEAITGGAPTLDVRYRYEFVTQDNALRNANASTIGTRIGYQTGSVHGVSAYFELSNVSTVFADGYNSTRNGKSQYAVVADPAITVLNRAVLSYTGLPATRIAYGRQRVILDNARFIGNVGWRQTEQTYDALQIDNGSLPGTALTYLHITNANTVTGGDTTMHSDIAHVAYTGLPFGALSAYAYLLDFVNSTTSSSKTFGLRFAGTHPLARGWTALYTAEYAQQSDYRNNPRHFDLNYWRAELGAAYHGVAVTAGDEVLGSNGSVAVQTPLATLHAMNGWADQFLVTPAQGLEDRFVDIGGVALKTKLAVVYHQFRTRRGHAALGREWDLKAARRIGKIYMLLVKFAAFHAEGGGKVNTTKAWVMGRMAF